jgi:hypothetical protein
MKWFVIVGIVLVLSSLVFASNIATNIVQGYSCDGSNCCEIIEEITTNCFSCAAPSGSYIEKDFFQITGCSDASMVSLPKQSLEKDISTTTSTPELRPEITMPGNDVKEIDLVWSMIGGKVRGNNDIFYRGNWIPFNDVYELRIEEIKITPKTIEEIKTNYGSMIDMALERTKINRNWIIALIYIESRGDPKAVSTGAAAGLMQFIPGTAIDYGLKVSYKGLNLPNFKTSQEYKNYIGTHKRWSYCAGNLVSPCNYCDRSKCDYENDERFKPEKAIPAAVNYLKNLGGERDMKTALKNYHGSTDAKNEEYYAKIKKVYDSIR